jgi:hypothetical protein
MSSTPVTPVARTASASRFVSNLPQYTPDAASTHGSPEAAVGGTIALIEEHDSITIDAGARLLRLNVSDEELARR